MRCVVLLIFMVLCFPALSFSQISLTTGIKGGISSSTFGGDATGNQSTLRGTVAGLFFEIDLPGPINIQPEVLYCTKGSAASSPAVTTTTSLTYFEIPFLIRYSLSIPVIEPALFAGPSIGMLLGAKRKTETTSSGSVETDIKSGISNTDYGIVVGASISLPLYITDLSAEARYFYGLKPLAKDGLTKQYNRVATLMVGITL
jgi:hypothetical protein